MPKTRTQDPTRRVAQKPTRVKAAATTKSGARVERGVVVRKPKPRKKHQRKAGRGYTAATADKYELYQKAVQAPELDIAFLRRIFRTMRGREALHFREDFCGTALLSATWLEVGKPGATAEGFDLDPEPIAWGLAHHFHDLGPKAAGFTAHLRDVREPGTRAYDVRVAQNFSHFTLTTRREMLEYFEKARESLARDGIFVIDLYGGSDATEVMDDTTKFRGFTYVWEQAHFSPGTGEYVNHITFRFPDGTALERVFSYRWRMWYLTELVDLLEEAGFAKVERYFEGWNARGTAGDGIFRKGLRGENCASWIAYLVASK